MIERLAWVTASGATGLDDDEPLALAALRRAGAEVDVTAWDDPAVDWASYQRAVLRSTWDYQDRMAEFLDWLAAVDQVTDLRNPLPVVRWNLDKRYLAELAEAGVPTIETVFSSPTDGALEQPARLPSGSIVVKPAVGAGSRNVGVYHETDRHRALEHIRRLHAAGVTALVQPLIASVARDGEWPLLFFGGHYSHAAGKRVDLPDAGMVDGLFVAETNVEHRADAAQIEVATAAVEVVAGRFGTPVYARVDLVRDDEGQYRVLELELVEPSLFLPQGGAGAVDRLVAELLAERP